MLCCACTRASTRVQARLTCPTSGAGYALLTALQHLVRPNDQIEVLALQSEHRDGTDASAGYTCHMIADHDLEEYRKVLSLVLYCSALPNDRNKHAVQW